MPYASLDARRTRARERYARSSDVRAKASANAKRQAAKRFENAEARERWRQWKRNARRVAAQKEGRQFRARHGQAASVHKLNRLNRKNARDAWRYWINVLAPEWWMADYYEARAKPWRNPRLTEAERYAVRYQLDEAFSQKERERASARRWKNPVYAAQWSRSGGRWCRAAWSDDGSVTDELLAALRNEAHCAYCGDFTSPRMRHIDHVWPLAHGGGHRADNLVMACRRCNFAKRDQLPLRWLLSLEAVGADAGRGGDERCGAQG